MKNFKMQFLFAATAVSSPTYLLEPGRRLEALGNREVQAAYFSLLQVVQGTAPEIFRIQLALAAMYAEADAGHLQAARERLEDAKTLLNWSSLKSELAQKGDASAYIKRAVDLAEFDLQERERTARTQ